MGSAEKKLNDDNEQTLINEYNKAKQLFIDAAINLLKAQNKIVSSDSSKLISVKRDNISILTSQAGVQVNCTFPSNLYSFSGNPYGSVFGAPFGYGNNPFPGMQTNKTNEEKIKQEKTKKNESHDGEF